MNQHICKVIGIPGRSTRLVCLALTLALNGCGDTGAIREQEQARYETLENELISAQEDEERRRRAQFRVAQKLQQMDAERTAEARARRQALDKRLTAPQHNAALSPTDSLPDSASVSKPLVKSIIVGQAPSDSDNPVWRLQNYPSPIDGAAICAVVSTPVIVRNGSLDTRVTIIVSRSTVFLRTDASFDTTSPETGYRIDARLPIAFDRFFNELTAVNDESHERLLDAMQTGTTMRVMFAYSPQLSASETHAVELALESFAALWAGISQCESQN